MCQVPGAIGARVSQRGPGAGPAMTSQTKAAAIFPDPRRTSALIGAALQDHDRADRTARTADDRERTRGKHEFVTTRHRQLAQQQTFQQRDAEIADQTLMHREYGALR